MPRPTPQMIQDADGILNRTRSKLRLLSAAALLATAIVAANTALTLLDGGNSTQRALTAVSAAAAAIGIWHLAQAWTTYRRNRQKLNYFKRVQAEVERRRANSPSNPGQPEQHP